MENSCWCNTILGILVIVFAWWATPWNNWILTVLGIIIVLIGLTGKCCCKAGGKKK